MDSILMGNFIAEKRKTLELTQGALAEKLGVDEKLVMKWEEKNVLPKDELILPLCEVLGCTATELVAGKQLSEDEIKAAAENNALTMVRQQNSLKKRKTFELILILATLLSSCAAIFSIVLVSSFEAVFTVGFKSVPLAMYIVLGIITAIAIISAITTLIVLFKGEPDYVCTECKTRFQPEIKDYMESKSEHSTRQLTCPHCEKKVDCKKKENIIALKKK